MKSSIARVAFVFVMAAASSALAGCDALRGNGDLLASLPNPSYLPECAAADDLHVYWTASGHVFRVLRSGGPLEDFAAIDGKPGAIGVLGPEVVFLDQDSGTLHGKPKAGGAVRTIAKLAAPPSLRCMPEDEHALYASGRGRTKMVEGSFAMTPYAVAVRIDKATGAVSELLRNDDDDLAVAIDGTDVYLQSAKNLYAVTIVPKNGGPSRSLSTRDPRLDPRGSGGHFFYPGAPPIAVAGGTVYAVGGENGLDPVYTLPATGGVPAPLKVRMTGPSAQLVAAKGGVCAADAFDVLCFDASGKSRRYGRAPMARAVVARGDDLYWFATSPMALRHARL